MGKAFLVDLPYGLSRLQHLEELIRLASKAVLSKDRKLEALKREILRLSRRLKSQSEDLERIEKEGLR